MQTLNICSRIQSITAAKTVMARWPYCRLGKGLLSIKFVVMESLLAPISPPRLYRKRQTEFYSDKLRKTKSKENTFNEKNKFVYYKFTYYICTYKFI